MFMKSIKIIRITIIICLIGLIYGAFSLEAEAAPALFKSNYYEFVEVSNPYDDYNNTWATANTAASARNYNGVNGHLATIKSSEENDFLYGLVAGNFSGFTGAWLGGKHPAGWLTGPENGYGFTYSNWGGSEPNNSGFAYMNIGTLYAGINPGKWADASSPYGFPIQYADPVIGYFVEYENAAPVPLPAAILFLGSGLASLASVRFRRKKQ
jgi:hypothetical protein